MISQCITEKEQFKFMHAKTDLLTVSFQRVPLFWNVADPVKPLNSYSAQINYDITIWNGLCFVTGVKRKRINWIL